VLRIAARNHDHGKNCARWQNAFSAPEMGRPYAKTPGPFRNSLLDGYRHEFGSLPSVERDAEFAKLSDEHKELTLHLVAAHHGFGRPVIRVDSCDDAPPSVLADRARDVALRFARMQKQWGPWGLAWLESILRAADHRASALVDDEPGSSPVGDTEKEAILG
jgi:CRISPR-associated endonuclease/helicase Cas3